MILKSSITSGMAKMDPHLPDEGPSPPAGLWGSGPRAPSLENPSVPRDTASVVVKKSSFWIQQLLTLHAGSWNTGFVVLSSVGRPVALSLHVQADR